MTRILVVEDDAFGRRYLESILRDAGWTVVVTPDGTAAWAAFEHADVPFDVVVTDIRMPGLSGIDLITRIRALDPVVGVIAVSAMGDDEQVVAGLEAGADDYLTKPFSERVLVAKVRAALRRAADGDDRAGREKLEVGPLQLESRIGVATKLGRALALTRTEFALLEYLMRNQGRIVSPAQILGAVWGEAYEEDTEILRVAVLRLRRKVEDDPANPALLRTHVGFGYSLGLPA